MVCGGGDGGNDDDGDDDDDDDDDDDGDDDDADDDDDDDDDDGDDDDGDKSIIIKIIMIMQDVNENWVQSLEFRVQWFKVQVLGSKAQGLEFRMDLFGSGFRVKGLGFGVEVLKFRVQG